MGIGAPLTKTLPKSYQNLTLSFPGPLYTSLTVISPVVSYRKRPPIGSLSTAGALVRRFRVDTDLQQCCVEGPRRAWRSSPAPPCQALGGTRRARAVRERGRRLKELSACMTRIPCERLTG